MAISGSELCPSRRRGYGLPFLIMSFDPANAASYEILSCLSTLSRKCRVTSAPIRERMPRIRAFFGGGAIIVIEIGMLISFQYDEQNHSVTTLYDWIYGRVATGGRNCNLEHAIPKANLK